MENIDKKLLEEARMVARRVHATQTYSIFPYEKHLNDVEQILIEAGYGDNTTIMLAGILHDTLEDAALSYNDIKKYFGMEVAEIVFAVTDELGRNRQERKQKTLPKTAGNRDAVAVKLANRIANVEHSKRSGSSMFKRYQQEQNQFYQELWMPGEHELLWSRLASVML